MEAVRDFLMQQLIYVGFNTILDGRYPQRNYPDLAEDILDNSERYLDQRVQDCVKYVLDNKHNVFMYNELFRNESDPEQLEHLGDIFQKHIGLPIWATFHLDSADIFKTTFLPKFLLKVQNLL